MADFETIRYGVHDGVATITLNRPDKRNAVSAQMFQDLGDAADQAAMDPGIRVVLVTGEGSSFCAGIDIMLMGQLAGTRGARFRSFIRTAQRPFAVLAQMDKPAVAAVQGHAVGAGFQLALACDLRIAADDVRFALLEIQFGIIPDLGGPHRLTRLIGPARTKDLIWTRRNVHAEEAERLGLANRVVPADALTKEAEAYARELVAAPPLPVSLTKSLVGRSYETTFETDLERQAQAPAACLESEDHREAIEAFVEKRPARFHGR